MYFNECLKLSTECKQLQEKLLANRASIQSSPETVKHQQPIQQIEVQKHIAKERELTIENQYLKSLQSATERQFMSLQRLTINLKNQLQHMSEKNITLKKSKSLGADDL